LAGLLQRRIKDGFLDKKPITYAHHLNSGHSHEWPLFFLLLPAARTGTQETALFRSLALYDGKRLDTQASARDPFPENK
jgi:hypothetical protein